MKAKNLFVASILGATMAVSSAFAAPPDDLTRQVDNALRSAGLIFVYPKVSNTGVVSLWGQVLNDYDFQRAGAIAQSVPGVTSVVNTLDVPAN